MHCLAVATRCRRTLSVWNPLVQAQMNGYVRLSRPKTLRSRAPCTFTQFIQLLILFVIFSCCYSRCRKASTSSRSRAKPTSSRPAWPSTEQIGLSSTLHRIHNLFLIRILILTHQQSKLSNLTPRPKLKHDPLTSPTLSHPFPPAHNHKPRSYPPPTLHQIPRTNKLRLPRSLRASTSRASPSH